MFTRKWKLGYCSTYYYVTVFFLRKTDTVNGCHIAPATTWAREASSTLAVRHHQLPVIAWRQNTRGVWLISSLSVKFGPTLSLLCVCLILEKSTCGGHSDVCCRTEQSLRCWAEARACVAQWSAAFGWRKSCRRRPATSTVRWAYYYDPHSSN